MTKQKRFRITISNEKQATSGASKLAMKNQLGERSHEPIARLYTSENEQLPGYDSLRSSNNDTEKTYPGFSPNKHYAAYMNIHKVFVGRSGGRELISIADELEKEWLPDYLDAGGWAAAEAGLVCDDLPTSERMNLINRAEVCWQQAIINQDALSSDPTKEYLSEDTDQFRLALNLAFSPMMKSIVAGNVTRSVRERTFADTLAIAQLSALQLSLASKQGNVDAVGDHLGFGHECNALLALLYLNDPNNLPLPSTYRAGSGYEYRSQTHDIAIINQHWGDIHRVFPAEIKAAASFRDKQRYKALIIRGKMHLAIPGKFKPIETTDAFGRCFDGNATPEDQKIVHHATTTVKELLALYQKGDCPDEFKRIRTHTKFHTNDKLAEKYKEFSLERRAK